MPLRLLRNHLIYRAMRYFFERGITIIYELMFLSFRGNSLTKCWYFIPPFMKIIPRSL